MKLSFKKLLLLCLPAALFFTACNNDDEEDPKPTSGTLNFNFRHMVGDKDLEYNTVKFVTQQADTFVVEDFRYYISNIKLYSSATGNAYAEPNSYHLMNPGNNADAVKTGFTLSNIPFATYDRIEFSIGVDSMHNHSIDQVGDLSPNTSMAWDWDTGYKFLVMEGRFWGQTYPDSARGLVFHVGDDSNYKTLTFDLAAPVMVGNSEIYTVNFITDVNEIFQNPNAIDFDVMNAVMGKREGGTLATNYANGMIRFNGLSR